jgi:hypothetical protein
LLKRLRSGAIKTLFQSLILMLTLAVSRLSKFWFIVIQDFWAKARREGGYGGLRSGSQGCQIFLASTYQNG